MFTVTGVTTSLLFLVAKAVCKQTVVAQAILDFPFVEECMETFACQIASVSGQCLQPIAAITAFLSTCAVAGGAARLTDATVGDHGNGFFKWTPIVSHTPSS